MAVGLATNCKITQVCKFDRKNYFYPDNPQNYQISQLYLPIARDGYVEIEVGEQKKKVRIHEMHMEEDAGMLIHDEWEDCSLVDYNRKIDVCSHGSFLKLTVRCSQILADHTQFFQISNDFICRS